MYNGIDKRYLEVTLDSTQNIKDDSLRDSLDLKLIPTAQCTEDKIRDQVMRDITRGEVLIEDHGSCAHIRLMSKFRQKYPNEENRTYLNLLDCLTTGHKFPPHQAKLILASTQQHSMGGGLSLSLWLNPFIYITLTMVRQ